MRYGNSGVKFTCPDIDSVKGDLIEAVKSLQSILSATDDKDLISDIGMVIDELTPICLNSNCLLENLRDSNIALREFGEEQHSSLGLAEKELDRANYEISRLEQTIASMKEDIRHLESELKEIA